MRSTSVSAEILKIVKQHFPDGCYLPQVQERYMELHPELIHKQARVKVDKSLRFLEKKGNLYSILDEGLKRRYSLTVIIPEEVSVEKKSAELLIAKYRYKSKEAHIKLASAKSEWEHLKSFQQIAELQGYVDDLVAEAEQELNQLIGIDAAYEKLLNKLESSCV